jgi:hypothetical protein
MFVAAATLAVPYPQVDVVKMNMHVQISNNDGLIQLNQ